MCLGKRVSFTPKFTEENTQFEDNEAEDEAVRFLANRTDLRVH